jgi:hypothetical protein
VTAWQVSPWGQLVSAVPVHGHPQSMPLAPALMSHCAPAGVVGHGVVVEQPFEQKPCVAVVDTLMQVRPAAQAPVEVVPHGWPKVWVPTCWQNPRVELQAVPVPQTSAWIRQSGKQREPAVVFAQISPDGQSVGWVQFLTHTAVPMVTQVPCGHVPPGHATLQNPPVAPEVIRQLRPAEHVVPALQYAAKLPAPVLPPSCPIPPPSCAPPSSLPPPPSPPLPARGWQAAPAQSFPINSQLLQAAPF